MRPTDVPRQAGFNALSDRLDGTGLGAVVATSTERRRRTSGVAGRGQAALATLLRTEREVLDLAYWCGLTQSEIAIALGIPRGTVKSRTFSALARLREALGQVPEPAPSTVRPQGA